MSDGPPTLKRPDVPGGADDPAASVGLAEPALAYDYFKSMVSLSVATLGGILTLAGTVFGARISPLQMGMAALPVAISGLLALQGQTDIVQLCQGVKPRLNSSRAALRLVPSLYGLGIGIFLAFLLVSYVAPELG
ncbi:hypothetical protein [Brevundimonas variabilis]|uniref:Uncharacterized protein n=1 Tax=Brevundimonas variabilis TaxID=74312 RepID=A0A7W9CF52_9CAUL|nr:hypothetical protein [Brevundimonas variabilis]MBB5744480.1 hypothetical protein [Brevundimonas variabilis]